MQHVRNGHFNRIKPKLVPADVRDGLGDLKQWCGSQPTEQAGAVLAALEHLYCRRMTEAAATAYKGLLAMRHRNCRTFGPDVLNGPAIVPDRTKPPHACRNLHDVIDTLLMAIGRDFGDALNQKLRGNER
jgi:hypothetical protein